MPLVVRCESLKVICGRRLGPTSEVARRPETHLFAGYRYLTVSSASFSINYRSCPMLPGISILTSASFSCFKVPRQDGTL